MPRTPNRFDSVRPELPRVPAPPPRRVEQVLTPDPNLPIPGEPVIPSEAECLALLVKRYRWTWIAAGQLRRYDPFGVMPLIRKAVDDRLDATPGPKEETREAA